MLKQRLIFRLDKLLRQDAFTTMCARNETARQSCTAFIHPRRCTDNVTKKPPKSCKTAARFDAKLYSTSTRVSKINETTEHKLQAKPLKFDQNDVLSYLDVCINSQTTDLAYKTLQYYHKCGSLDDIRPYNRVLAAYAARGDWDTFENIMEMVSNSSAKPNLQTYVCAIECAYRAEKNHSINKILDEIASNGFDVRDLFFRCNLVGDQRNVVFEAIRSQIADFEPNKMSFCQSYTGNLLENLNNASPMDGVYNLLGLHDAVKLKDMAGREMEAQLKGYRTIGRIDHTVKFREENAELLKKMKAYESNWAKEMLINFQNKLEEHRKFHDESDGRINLFPYLSALTPDEFVDLMFQNFTNLTMMPKSTEITLLKERFGFSVMDKYLLQNKIKSDGFKYTKKLYNEYCEYFVNPELSSRYTSRQYWDSLKAKYSDEFIDDQTEQKWPKSVLFEIGEIMFSIMDKVIQIDWNFLENNTSAYKKHFLSPFVHNVREFNGIERVEIKNNFSARRYFGLVNAGEFKLNLGDFPMLSPPIPWNSMSSGGYLYNHRFSERAFLRGNDPIQENYLRQTNVRNLFPYFDSANNLAECPWKINTKVLDTILEVFDTWDNPAMDGFTSYQTETNKQTTKLLFGVKQAKGFETKVFHWLTKLSIANALRADVFWFPHYIDFRGRCYPMSKYLNYHWSDADRGLLLFARGEPLGHDGLDWLKLHLIGLTDGSRNKTSLKDRIDYCDELLPEITDSADNPLKGNGWWKTSSKPWQTLACSIELTAALRSPDPRAYVCHYPVHQDGYCNGLQHFAALGRDLDTATEVNLAPNVIPKDLYTGLTDSIEEVRKKDAAKGNRFARNLEGVVTRQFVKMPLLMMVYDVNLEGTLLHVSDQLKDISGFPYDQRKLVAQYFVEKLWTIFQAEFPKVKEIKSWLSECAKCISQTYDQPVRWVTPIGLPIIQQYYEVGKPFGKKPMFRAATKALNIQKQSTAFTSNYIQSLDACHMVLTSLHCRRRGIPFVSVHDSFWSHPSRAAEMNKICREQFVALHSESLLESLSKQLNEQFCGDLEKKTTVQEIIAKVPSKGSFDIENVLNATFFFS